MARRGGSSTQRQTLQPVPNGNSTGHPPPSTIPAQIVQNAANANAQNNAAIKRPIIDEVRQFLQNPTLEDPDPVVNAFISTITLGGIDPFFKEDPFAQSYLEEQASCSIAALRLIFQQRPKLLLAARHIEEDEGSPQPPFIIWLLPKLLG